MGQTQFFIDENQFTAIFVGTLIEISVFDVFLAAPTRNKQKETVIFKNHESTISFFLISMNRLTDQKTAEETCV